MSIQELLDLEDIEENELRYLKEYGYSPFNVSTWNPSIYFSNKYILNQVKLIPSSYIPYIYSYELDDNRLNLIKKALGSRLDSGCLVTNNGTSAIALVTSVLKEIGIKRLLVISPTYYAILYNCIQKQIELKEIHVSRAQNNYILPIQEICKALDSIDAIWITNPVYNTGIYYTEEDINFLKTQIPQRILLVCDDCFALHGNEFIRYFCDSPNFININDPLKQIMVNGLKFSCITYPSKYQALFEQWSDIICGSLAYSTVQSIDFFISNDFKQLCNNLSNHIFKLNCKLFEIANAFPSISLDKKALGHMHMCYINHLPFDYLQNKEKMYHFMKETGTSIIPGNRFHFPTESQFSFRINLGRECLEFWDALIRIFSYFSSYAL